VKDVAQVRPAPAALYLGTPHGQTGVFCGADLFGPKRSPEARPPGSRVKFGFGVEQFIAAADALVDSFFCAVVIFPRKRPFSSLLPTDVKLLWCQLRFPFLFGLGQLVRHIYPFSLDPSTQPAIASRKVIELL
jgi:hypothetical protein